MKGQAPGIYSLPTRLTVHKVSSTWRKSVTWLTQAAWIKNWFRFRFLRAIICKIRTFAGRSISPISFLVHTCTYTHPLVHSCTYTHHWSQAPIKSDSMRILDRRKILYENISTPGSLDVSLRIVLYSNTWINTGNRGLPRSCKRKRPIIIPPKLRIFNTAVTS